MTTADAGHSPENQPTEADQSSEESRAIAVPESSVPESIAALKERLRFYESFDRLIHENVARSSELLREAIDLRERTEMERAQAMAAAERTVAAERQTQRDLLSSLLQDLISLQQVTERLAQRVTDALEIVESQLEPPGLKQGTTQQLVSGELPDLLSLGQAGAQSGTERETTADRPTERLGDETTTGVDQAELASWDAPSDTVADRPFEDEEEGADERALEDVMVLSAPESGGSPAVPETPDVESLPGEGEDSAPGELSGVGWQQPEAERPQAENNPVTAQAEAPPAAPADGTAAPTDAPTATDDGAEKSTAPGQAPTASEVANWFATTTPLSVREPEPSLPAPGGVVAGAGQLAPEASRNESLRAEPTERQGSYPATTAARENGEERATERGPFLGAAEVAEPGTRTEPVTGRFEEMVVVHGVPTAALALSLQRYLLSLPPVQTVETREYHNGILRFHVVTTTRLTLGDLRGWPEGNDFQPVRDELDTIEVRLPSEIGPQA